jgi:hypothetical protein
MEQVSSVNIAATTDTSLVPYSHSMLNAIATCPTQGLVTYVANKIMAKGGRAMALEAGSAAHEAFAAARLWQVGRVQGFEDHMHHHGLRLFGEDRFGSMMMAAADGGDDMRNSMLRFCLDAFYTCGFYDDPNDRRRTFTNIEEALIAYLDRFDYKRDVWISDKAAPSAPIGIELPIDFTVTFLDEGGYVIAQIRFIGTADGVTVKGDEFRLEENKTASRLGEAWSNSFWTSHQVTGYMIGMQACYGLPITKAGVHGMAIPLPRSYDAGGLMSEVVTRVPTQFTDFITWLLHQVGVIQTYGHAPYDAPKNTGACNKYYRPCSFIPLCASAHEDRKEMFDEMVERDLTPTEKAMEDGGGND